jgi:phage FluMu protein Com
MMYTFFCKNVNEIKVGTHCLSMLNRGGVVTYIFQSCPWDKGFLIKYTEEIGDQSYITEEEIVYDRPEFFRFVG